MGSLHAHRGRIGARPEINVVIIAFLLNYPWEFLQVPFYAGMAEASHWAAILFCSSAAVGDAAIALVAFWMIAVGSASGRLWLADPTRHQVIAFISAGIVMTFFLEWLNTEVLGRWEYADLMPTLPLLGTGLLPVLQWTVLPPLIVWFGRRLLLGSLQVQHRSISSI